MGEVKTQLFFYQDVFEGGVTAGGFSTGMGIGTGTVNLNIEPGSSIRKAFVFTFSTGENTNQPIEINSINYYFGSSNVISSFLNTNTFFSPIYIHCIDITSALNNLQTSTFLITIPSQPELPFKGVFAPFIYIAYQNSMLPLCNTNIVVNNQNLRGNEVYAVNNLNPMNTSFPVGFSLYSDRSMDGLPPDGQVFFNSNFLGVVGGSDNVNSLWNYGGVKGHFYYQNNTLFGLDDDTPDAVMDRTDGLSDVSSYLLNNATSCNFQLLKTDYPNHPINETHVNLAYFLTYTTPCDTFSVNLLTEDTTICQGETVQLGVVSTSSTSPTYEWLPQKDLSCYNCPNPVFSGDSSQVYTVRIWNTDSCSKVLPVSVKVLQTPSFSSLSTSPSVCGSSTGSLVASSLSNSDSLFLDSAFVGLAPQTLQNLSSGIYTLYLKDTNGCRSADSTLNIASVNNTVAQFSVNPQTGGAPLTVNISNTSQNATFYDWYVNGILQSNPFNQFTADTSGTYQIMLVAWQNDIVCADTSYQTILVYDSLIVSIPNVFTPNGDGINDYFAINSNLPVHAKLNILNRWGEEVYHFEGDLQQGLNKLWNGYTTLFNGSITDGVYFYQLTIQELNAIDNEQLKKEGFVTVVK